MIAKTINIIAVLLAASSALAQPQVAPPPAPVPPMPAVAPAPPLPPIPPMPAWPFATAGDDALMFASAGVGRQVVKGAPYTATAVSETRQTLADGNRITRSSSTQLARDSEGRTRQEQSSGTVFISDPVAGKRYVLDLKSRAGRELPLAQRAPEAPGAVNADELRARAEELRRWAQELSGRLRVEITGNARVSADTRADDAGRVTERVEIVRLSDGRAEAPLPPAPPLVPMAVPGGPGVTTPLGSRDVAGVRADGTRTTWTIPAGRIGNDKPIEIVSERWYSPDLMLVVESRYADPRSGERLYRLENLKRGEPSAELFQVPAEVELRSRAAPRAREGK